MFKWLKDLFSDDWTVLESEEDSKDAEAQLRKDVKKLRDTLKRIEEEQEQDHANYMAEHKDMFKAMEDMIAAFNFDSFNNRYSYTYYTPERVVLKWKRLCKNAYAPVKFHEEDACFDLTPCEIGGNGDLRLCKFGIAVEIPKGYVGLIFPRSSVYKTCCRLSNCVGVVDSGYTGELKAVFDILDKDYDAYKVGERCCQLMLVQLPTVELQEVDELAPSDRGKGGFGSTGR